jgi:hypothetical protein
MAEDSASQIADGSVDFVFFNGDSLYRAVRRSMDRWYPKVRPGGVLAGSGYIDGAFTGRVYGTRTAANELAGREGALVCVTLDELPAWWFVKPGTGAGQAAARGARVGVLTAYDAGQRDLAIVSSPNRASYCVRHGYTMIEETGGFDRSRVPAWSKLLFLRKHLPHFDWLYWSDADSLVMDGTVRMERFLDESYDLVVTREDVGVGMGGINAGQFFLKRSDWSLRFLDEVWVQTQFVGHPMEEQAAMMHLMRTRDLSRNVKIVTQRSFNSYPLNYQRGDFLLHFAGLRGEHRLRQMRTFEQFSTV